jgi:dTMP kinase
VTGPRPRHGDDRDAPGRGFFVSLDGPDGGGKTTQAALLARSLGDRGLDVVTCRDPGGTGLGDRLRAILLDRHATPIGLRAEMLLYMASRAQLVEEVIRPALAAGRVVVSDRYLLANVVYQGHAGGLPIDEVWTVGRAATGGLMPDLTLLLDLPPDLATARVGAARDRMEDRPASFREAVRRGFLDAVPTYPAPIRLIDAAGAAEAVAARIEMEVTHALGLPARS